MKRYGDQTPAAAWFARLTLRDGTTEEVGFPDYKTAYVFVHFIPYRQLMFGEQLDVARAILRPARQSLN